jgi:NAD(P)H-dependent FMN reductase
MSNAITPTRPDDAGRVAVVVGSTRPNRICGTVAAWTLRHLAANDALRCELVDLAEISLPFLDEPLKPALGRYEREHTRRWSTLVRSYDVFVFVFPQYNWGYPAVLKNALDFLYAEWHDKPAGMVSYGTRGGGKGAAQLREVLQGLHMRPVDDNVEVKITAADVDDVGRLVAPETALRPFVDQVHAMADGLLAASADGQLG